VLQFGHGDETVEDAASQRLSGNPLSL
jgi:hypothetical protein